MPWQRPVSSVNDLWRVSRCVSLGSFRFVSTELYLRAPFMGPQVWPPSPPEEVKGGVLPNSPAASMEDSDGKLMSMMGLRWSIESEVSGGTKLFFACTWRHFFVSLKVFYSWVTKSQQPSRKSVWWHCQTLKINKHLGKCQTIWFQWVLCILFCF